MTADYEGCCIKGIDLWKSVGMFSSTNVFKFSVLLIALNRVQHKNKTMKNEKHFRAQGFSFSIGV